MPKKDNQSQTVKPKSAITKDWRTETSEKVLKYYSIPKALSKEYDYRVNDGTIVAVRKK